MAMLDERFESAIDAAARQMTEGEVPADFKARVLARIESSEHRRWPWPSAWAPSPLAVAAVVMLAALVLRAPWRSSPAAPLGPASPVALTQAPRSRIQRNPVAARGGLTGARPAARSSDEIAWSATAADELALASIDIEPLHGPVEAIDSMALAPLGVGAMDSMESIDVPRLAVAALEVSTLESQ
jgi:hypothetical protein